MIKDIREGTEENMEAVDGAEDMEVVVKAVGVWWMRCWWRRWRWMWRDGGGGGDGG